MYEKLQIWVPAGDMRQNVARTILCAYISYVIDDNVEKAMSWLTEVLDRTNNQTL